MPRDCTDALSVSLLGNDALHESATDAVYIIWGMPSKIIAFIVCLLCVAFPITGTIMWYNRTRKKAKVEKRKEAEVLV